METYLSVYLTFLSLLLVITTGISIRAFINWHTPGARTLGAFMMCMTIWAAFYLLEIFLPSLEGKLFARKALYLGMTLAPAFWLGFAIRYTGLFPWWSHNGRVVLLSIPGWIVFWLGVTNESHSLIWTSLSLPKTQPAPLVIEYGIGFWVYTFIVYAMILIGCALLIFSYFKYGKALRLKSGIVLAGVFLTTAVNAFFLLIENDLSIDPTPLSFAISAPLIAMGFFRFGVSKLFPLAAALVVENLRDAILVVNWEDKVTDINQAAIDLLGVERFKENISVFSILPQADKFRELWDSSESSFQLEMRLGAAFKWYEARVVLIQRKGEEHLGRVIVFHDITSEHKLLQEEKRRSQHLSLLEETGRRIAGSFDEHEILQRTVEAITQRLGYPETAISILTKDNMLEVAVISGTEDFDYNPGYKQNIGTGIIGHTAGLQKTYVTPNVSEDAHYFSTSSRSGSAICTPLFNQGALYGVLYVESFELNAFDELDIITLETLASQVSESLQRASLYAQTQKDLRTITTIQNISRLVAGSLDMETISRTVVESLKKVFGYTHVSIYLLAEEYLLLSAEVGYPAEMIISKVHVSQGVMGRCIRTKAVQFIQDAESEGAFLKADHHILSEICVPLLKKDIVLGILNVESTRSDQLTPADVDLLTSIAGPIAVAVDNARLHAELKKMATTDAVTGLFNRHVLEQALDSEMERAERNGVPLSLIVFDIDSFKRYNDQWGHPAGDTRLKAVANVIKRNLRKYDIAARYGGDEFAIILTDCGQAEAVRFAERLSKGTQTGAPAPLKDESEIPGYTLSIGIAAFPADAATANELLIAADNAALRSKQQGKNRIRTAGDYEAT